VARWRYGGGARQGCPLSPTLYVMYIEGVLREFERRVTRRVSLPGGEAVRYPVFADDVTVFCRDRREVERVLEFFKEVETMTGAGFNAEKTKVLVVEGAPMIQGVETEVRICGVWFEGDGKKNMTEISRKVQKRLNDMVKFEMSVVGKVLAINTMVVSIVRYVSVIFLPGQGMLKQLEKMAFSFLWGEGKTEMVRREGVRRRKVDGGLGMGT